MAYDLVHTNKARLERRYMKNFPQISRMFAEVVMDEFFLKNQRESA
jgi:hypothetical protein